TALFSKWCTNKSTAMSGHKINDLWSYFISSCYEVSFILSIFIVNYNNNLSHFDVSNCFFNGVMLYFSIRGDDIGTHFLFFSKILNLKLLISSLDLIF